MTLSQVRHDLQPDRSSAVLVSLDQPDGLLCHVSLILSTDSEVHVKEFWGSGDHVVTFSAPQTEAEEWDVLVRGPR